MKSGTKVALAMGTGYLLGRKHKMRLALLLGAAAATGRLSTSPGELLKRSPLGSATGLDKAGLGGRLAEAGKTAAVTVASSQIESLTDRLRSRTEDLRQGSGAEGEESEETQEGRQAQDEERPEEEDEYDGDESYEEEDEGEEPEEPEPPRGDSKTNRRSGQRAGQTEDTDESDQEPEGKRRPDRAAGARRSSPIRRGGR